VETEAAMPPFFFVIASAAKQSIARRKERMDCFAALAMTAAKGNPPFTVNAP
jgi:hypothetical protein